MQEIQIKKMCELDSSLKHQVPKLFVQGFYKDLSMLSKDVDKLEKTFENAFVSEVCYVALKDNRVVGMLCYSNNKTKAITIEKQKMIKEFGLIVGTIAYGILKKEFNKPVEYNDNNVFIECMTTSVESAGKGIATDLLKYIINNLPYTEFILDVVDTNEKAIGLYKKIGFKEFSRKEEKHPKQKGFNARIYMKLYKSNLIKG